MIRTIPWRGIERSLRSSAPPRAQRLGDPRRHRAHGRVPVERRAGAARVEPRSVRAPPRRADRPAPRARVRRDPDAVPGGEDRRGVLHRRRPAPEHADVARDPARRRSPAADLAAPRRAGAPRRSSASAPRRIPSRCSSPARRSTRCCSITPSTTSQRMQRINLILEAGHSSFGDRFEEMMNHELVRLRGAPLRRIQAVHIRPSEDIGALAADFVAQGRMKVSGMVARQLIQRLAAGRGRARERPPVLPAVRRRLRRRADRARAPRRREEGGRARLAVRRVLASSRLTNTDRAG